MQDIDFDEIDRAVNSVTRGRSDDRTSNPLAEIAQPTERVSYAQPQAPVVADTPTVPASHTVSPAARRSTGRFMDVVHPSSDMRPSTPNEVRSTTAAPAPTVAPREDPVEAPVYERPEPIARPDPVTTASTAFHWPDPIDVATAAPAENLAMEPTAPVIEVPAPLPEPTPVQIPEPVVLEEVAPLESPFLVDAKVEKRPLGAFSTTDTNPDLLVMEDFSTQLTAEVAETPEEEKEDILLLDTHSVDEEVPELIAARSEVSEAPNPIGEAPIEAMSVGPISINQQYKEQPRTTDQPSGAIFDTEAYHQPLVHPAKKRSGMLIAVWVVALILIGGAIGAGVYFVVLPLLG